MSRESVDIITSESFTGIKAYKNPADHAMLPGGRKIGELVSKKLFGESVLYDIVLKYPTDVQYDYTKYEDIISTIDINRLSRKTKVLIYCIIKYYHNEFMFSKYKNLQSLEKTEPLIEKLVLDDSTKQENDNYKMMNVV